MQWMPEAPKKAGDKVTTYVVVLSLGEAQTLRRAMQAKSPHLPPVVLFTVTGDVLAQSNKARDLIQTDPASYAPARTISSRIACPCATMCYYS